MKIAAHQLNFFPYLGFFYKVLNCDLFVLLDDVQYTKGGYTNRCKIKCGEKVLWLTVPVQTKGRFGQLIHEVEINNVVPWRDKFKKTLQQCYRKSNFFEQFYPKLEELLSREWCKLVDFNWAALQIILKELKITTTLSFSSITPHSGRKEDLIISLVKELGGDKYLSGKGASVYQSDEDFEKAGVKLEYSKYKPVRYPQLGKNFVPDLSIIDLIFNCGPEGVEFLK